MPARIFLSASSSVTVTPMLAPCGLLSTRAITSGSSPLLPIVLIHAEGLHDFPLLSRERFLALAGLGCTRPLGARRALALLFARLLKLLLQVLRTHVLQCRRVRSGLRLHVQGHILHELVDLGLVLVELLPVLRTSNIALVVRSPTEILLHDWTHAHGHQVVHCGYGVLIESIPQCLRRPLSGLITLRSCPLNLIQDQTDLGPRSRTLFESALGCASQFLILSLQLLKPAPKIIAALSLFGLGLFLDPGTRLDFLFNCCS